MLRCLLIGLITVGLMSPAYADQQEMRDRTCRYQYLQPGTWTAREEAITAKCAVTRWPVPGGLFKFVAVGACESHWWRFSNNGGSYLGLFQHSAAYWSSRVAWAMPDRWKVGPWQRWTNSRSQIVTTARMVHANGWSAWSCA